MTKSERMKIQEIADRIHMVIYAGDMATSQNRALWLSKDVSDLRDIIAKSKPKSR
jgi:hypothetical protein